ncbi:NPCBM/NEW2 domain-containing protein [Amycolatopsis sp. YIM 10]|uniref:NPCBM/NEW2 domain-containing protein n=1 Tax=Amycolatopsis sp. YIM 10 TaxID=2653857 RepID=UPI0012A8C99E|nr:NPCBM/NEW2 domain-containing protein [Amycolatopsis sp. YIM 10]QFU90534.1 Alpha-galactosidase A precursor [Amycolatopsis sp. YIM 10]
MSSVPSRSRHGRRFPALLAAICLAAGVPVLASVPAHAAPDVALTPPMGFNNKFVTGCGSGLNEETILGIADTMVGTGLRDAGYQFVNIDDCWALPQRNADGELVPDPVRFPRGVKALADDLHARGLKFGLYGGAGTKTCATPGIPGSHGHEEQDAKLFAAWGVDYLKYDNCNNQGLDAKQRYSAMADALRATGRPIVFAICEWGITKPWNWATGIGHSWRTMIDMNDSWSRLLTVLKQNMGLAGHAGPGGWNDPDLLMAGNGGMSATEYRSQFTLWATMAAPLLISTDLRKAGSQTLDLLRNPDVIAVNQDPLGIQGAPIRSQDGTHVFVKPLANGDRAVVLFNETDTARRISTSATEAGLPQATGYRLRDVWTHQDAHTAGTISATVPPHATRMYRVGADRHWYKYQPATDAATDPDSAYPGALPVLAPGTTTTITTTLTNSGTLPAGAVKANLGTPDQWPVRAASTATTPVLAGGKQFGTQWEVSVPAGTAPGTYALTGNYTYSVPHKPKPVTISHTLEVTIAATPAEGTSFLSDANWVRASNGWGPVEKDRANGEQFAGDGEPITLGGIAYAKGLGTHAPASIEYFTGGNCTSISALAGLHDGKPGTVAFRLWTDGTLAYDSGVRTAADPPLPIAADVTSAHFVRLEVTDGGDGTSDDHADWANPTITCE